ncbi:hypothetical protein AJ79_08400 [Helicocarpus griseus UAMH5409]|uniref:Integral membrane protein n=1 Tax=Helicocarpus griseus UAMH5409 TaxID=1447875 RepID=A0A2B7WTC1_9EURO|nr:hypothetical protein AJ79_08400 [Helicocarpus griseus UAMH5409]
MARVYVLLCAAALFTAKVVCESLVPNTASANFPACAVGCPLLEQAQEVCVPPIAPVTHQGAYVSCFCQSSLIQTLHSSPNGVCDACQPADRSLLQKWYAGICSPGSPETKTKTMIVTPTASDSKTNPTAGSNSAGTGTPPRVTYEAPPSWISTHWRWVLMVVILFIGFTALTILLVYLKRRHRRKRANQPIIGAPAAPITTTTATGGGASMNTRHPPSRNLVTEALAEDKLGPQQHFAHTRVLDFGHRGSPTPPAPGTQPSGPEAGQFTRAPSKNTRGTRLSKEQL